MPQFIAPDVYVEEVQGRSGQIGAPSTSTFTIAGFSPRGPEGKAYVNTSFKQFVDRFGGFSNKSLNAYAAAAFYQNGGTRLLFIREMHSDATYASGSLPNSTFNVRASGRGEWANGAEITVSGNINFYDQATASYSKFDLTVEVIDPTTGLLAQVESYEALELTDEEDPDYITKVVNDQSEAIYLTAVSGGVPVVLQPVTHTGISLGTGNGVQTSFSGSLGAIVPIGETTVKVYDNAVLVAVDDGQGNMTSVSGGPTISGTIDYETGALSVVIGTPPLSGNAITVDAIEKPASSVTVTLAGGSDGSAVVASDLTSVALKATKRGIYALDDVDEQMQLALPDYAGDKDTITALLTYASGRGDILVLCEPPKGTSPQNAANFKRNTLKSVSSYGAMYYPWINVPDPLNRNRPKLIPPCGHAAGRMAFTDQSENVGKAPAGVIRGQLNFLTGVERLLSKEEIAIVYSAQINAIRSDANVGTAIWGNKTLQVTGDFVEVNVRRLFIFLEKAQYTGLLDKLFEDVGPVTWGIIKTRLDTFLESLYLQNVIGSGVLDKSQAYKIIVDESNNPASVQQQKRIVVDEFIKPNLSAEFIHLRLQRVFDASQV